MNKAPPPSRLAGQADPPATSIFDQSRAAFETAARARSGMVHEFACTIFGRPVDLRIVGDQFAERVFAPLSHAGRLEDTTAELEIALWDVGATGIAPPVQSVAGSLPRSWQVGLETLGTSADGQIVGHQLHATVLWLHRGARQIVGWTSSSASLSLHQRGKPLQTMFSIWGHGCGVQGIHAGLVARDGRGVLLPGKSGSGKSTAALACAAAGFSFLSDDWVGVESTGGPPFMAYGLYSSVWLDPDHAARFPGLAVHATPTGSAVETKSLLLLRDAPEVQIASSASLSALALPRVVDRPASRPIPASRAEALLVLAPSTVLQLLPRSGRAELERLSQLAEELPAYWLELGRDLRAIPQHVNEILDAA